MTDENYEILPHQVIADLRDEVEILKNKLTEPDSKAEELILEIESLKDSIHELNSIFMKALETVKKDDDFSKSIQKLNERLDTVVTQNETIARGMIAVSDKVDSFTGNSPKQSFQRQAPVAQSLPPHLQSTTTGGPMDAPSGPAPMPVPPSFTASMGQSRPTPSVPSSPDMGMPPNQASGAPGEDSHSISFEGIPPPPSSKKRRGFF